MSRIPVVFLKAESSPVDDYRLHFTASSSPRTRFCPSFVPVLDHVFDPTNVQYIRQLFLTKEVYRRYSGIVFTSQRAVEAFAVEVLKHVANAGGSNGKTDLQNETVAPAESASSSFALFAVGPATHASLDEAIRDSNLSPLVTSTITGKEAGTSESLAHLILDRFNNPDNPDNTRAANAGDNNPGHLPLLFLTGKKHRDHIPKILQSDNLQPDQRVPVEEVIVYETQVRDSFSKDFETAVHDAMNLSCQDDNTELGQGSPHLRPPRPTVWVVAFSPSGCQSMLKSIEKIQAEQLARTTSGINPQLFIATIGPTTRDYLAEKHGVEAHVCAERPTPEAIAEGIDMFMRERNNNESKPVL